MLLEQEPGLDVCGEAADTTQALEALARAKAVWRSWTSLSRGAAAWSS